MDSSTDKELDEIVLGLVAGAMEFQNPKSVTTEGSKKAIGPKTAKTRLLAWSKQRERAAYDKTVKKIEVATVKYGLVHRPQNGYEVLVVPKDKLLAELKGEEE